MAILRFPRALTLIACLALVPCLEGARADDAPPPPPAPTGAVVPGGNTVTAPIVGADRDSHGCIGSAGYSWCAAEGECVRSWELARKLSLEEGEAAFTRYCTTGRK
ncbi:MAG TPA: hypothetical protein VK196_20840 [Magnetospirillum sp.]|nr:hypothetical protein [Magnetospirillum sp.]